MQLINLKIDRIIIHQVYQRDQEGQKVTPLQSHDYTRFDKNAMDTFVARVRDALGEDSSAVQMQIVNQDDGDLPRLVDDVMDLNDEDFAAASYDFALKLASAQQRRAIPGGILVVFTGTQGAKPKRFLGLIKAEVHSGYEKEVQPDTQEISLKYVEELLLTPGTRLYKTAAFFEKADSNNDVDDLNDKWTVMISDYQISRTDGKAAAQYFYSDFLGFGYPQTSARTTKCFYDSATEFIADLDVSDAEKSELLNALTTYLKVEKTATVSSSDFAAKYFDDETKDDFLAHMEDSGVPTSAFTKDIEHIASKLKFRKVKFGGDIKFWAPYEVFADKVTMETIDGDIDESGQPAQWTKIVVKDRVIEQQ
ncbi:nucleoid-associated protein [Marinobacter daepoensis]|uniref:Nucleoid-associated protein n=1 Tax=Marinobacter daepoensis TaxID=262077 RepID=A0ABS3BGY5_9GAMM|nr:nucleoid-associated protein [Marinobacter daepoensis]MBN7770758.1 nucleoid-associated protein [Marinobacter daepoensis]MBY6078619.1 nucleoid-associated protein [Marinobacter daepoensis]